MLSSNRCLRAGTRQFREQSDESDAQYQHFQSQLCAVWDTPYLKEAEVSSLVAEYYRPTNGRRLRASDIDKKQKPKRGCVSDFLWSVLFFGRYFYEN